MGQEHWCFNINLRWSVAQVGSRGPGVWIPHWNTVRNCVKEEEPACW